MYVTCTTPFTATFLCLLLPVNIFESKAKVETKPLFVMTVQLEQESTEHRGFKVGKSWKKTRQLFGYLTVRIRSVPLKASPVFSLNQSGG